MNLCMHAHFHRRFHLRLWLLVLCSSLLVACGWFRKEDKKPEYYAAVETPPLTIPETLDQPLAPGALVISAPPTRLPDAELVTVPPRITSANTGNSDNTRLGWSAEGVFLLINDTPESVQRRLNYAIKRAGMALRETPKEGVIEIDYRHEPEKQEKGFFKRMAFWRDDGPNYSGSYQIITRPDLDNTRIYIKNADGTDSDLEATEHLLNILAQRLG